MQITITLPKVTTILRSWKWGLLLIAAAVAAFVVLPLDSPTTLEATHAMPCADIDGDQIVTSTDLDKLASYFPDSIPPAPPQVDMNGNTVVDVADLGFVVGQIGTFTKCQDKPVGFQGGGPQINITKFGKYLLPKTCFDVLDAAQTFLFTVCDNDFQGGPPLDQDPANGLIRVNVSAGQYSVVESKTPVNHNPDPNKLTCDASVGKCGLIFLNTPNTNPWFPWDLNADGVVVAGDIGAVVAHFGECKKEGCP